MDCDALYHTDIVSEFRALESDKEIRAAVLSFREGAAEGDSKPKYSYVQVDARNNVRAIAEKVRVGPLANTGAYWFTSAHEFMDVAQAIIDETRFQQGEAYVSCVLEEYLRRGKTVRACIVHEHEYSNIGTPDCLVRYLNTQGRAFLFDLDGTLVDTTEAYVRAWDALLSKREPSWTLIFSTPTSVAYRTNKCVKSSR